MFLYRCESQYYLTPTVDIVPDGENRDAVARLFYFTNDEPDPFTVQVLIEKIPATQDGDPVFLVVPSADQFVSPHIGQFEECHFYGYSLEPGQTFEVTFPASESTFWFRRVVFRLKTEVGASGTDFERSIFPFGRLVAEVPEIKMRAAPATTASAAITVTNSLAAPGSLGYSDVRDISHTESDLVKQTTVLFQVGAIRIPNSNVSVVLSSTQTNASEPFLAEYSVEIPFGTAPGEYRGTVRFGSLNGGRVGVGIHLIVEPPPLDPVQFGYFPDCLGGPRTTPDPTPPIAVDACLRVFDLDYDLDVDMQDFAAFQNRFVAP